MRLYHGSNQWIVQPDLACTKLFKDFGRGFYLSADYAQAQGWARQTVDLLQTGRPCVTAFEWDEEGHNYDIVIGPIADDGVTYQLRRYWRGDITMDRLVEELKFARGLTIQYYFGTERALSYLKRVLPE